MERGKNITTNLIEKGYESVDLIQLAQDMDKQMTPVTACFNIWIF
jgi:hypothetical protein